MNVVIQPLAAGRAAISAHRGAVTGPHRQATLPSTSRGALDFLLVIGTLALVLGLAVVPASLTPLGGGLGEPAQARPPLATAGAGAPELWTHKAGHNHAPPAAMTLNPWDEAASTALPRVSATGPWTSPLYPHNGVTLWDRIRVSAQQDRRAYLLGTAIQMHTPQTAATPGPRF